MGRREYKKLYTKEVCDKVYWADYKLKDSWFAELQNNFPKLWENWDDIGFSKVAMLFPYQLIKKTLFLPKNTFVYRGKFQNRLF